MPVLTKPNLHLITLTTISLDELGDVRLDDVVGERLVGGLRRVHRVEEHVLRRRQALRQHGGAQHPHRRQPVPAAALLRLRQTCDANSHTAKDRNQQVPPWLHPWRFGQAIVV